MQEGAGNPASPAPPVALIRVCSDDLTIRIENHTQACSRTTVSIYTDYLPEVVFNLKTHPPCWLPNTTLASDTEHLTEPPSSHARQKLTCWLFKNARPARRPVSLDNMF